MSTTSTTDDDETKAAKIAAVLAHLPKYLDPKAFIFIPIVIENLFDAFGALDPPEGPQRVKAEAQRYVDDGTVL